MENLMIAPSTLKIFQLIIILGLFVSTN